MSCKEGFRSFNRESVITPIGRADALIRSRMLLATRQTASLRKDETLEGRQVFLHCERTTG
jgi:hypothetical protein